MSTRCQIIIKDNYNDELWFYRHHDGYPEGTLPLLNKFMDLVKTGQIRDNTMQASGWLVLIGAEEYDVKYPDQHFKSKSKSYNDWKCGSFEPCPPERHGDIEFLYTLDLSKRSIEIEEIYP